MTKEADKTKDIDNTDGIDIDLDNISEEQEMKRIREAIERQEQQIEELQDLVLDLSTRVAHDGGVGVCPDCHGPLVRIDGFLSLRSKIKCKRCDEVYHEY